MRTRGLSAGKRTQTKRDTVKRRVRCVICAVTRVTSGVNVGIVCCSAGTIFRGRCDRPKRHICAPSRGAVRGCRRSSAVIRIAVVVVIKQLHSGLDLPDIRKPAGISGFLSGGVKRNQHHSGQNADNGDNHQQFNQSEPFLRFDILQLVHPLPSLLYH